jgi:Eukaryotic-type carbonic anhydrase
MRYVQLFVCNYLKVFIVSTVLKFCACACILYLGPTFQLGTVAIFIKSVDGGPDWQILNKVICAWRDQEEKVREACGLDSVTARYDGCVVYTRQNTRRNLRNVDANEYKPATSAYDIILENEMSKNAAASFGNTTFEPTHIHIDDNHIKNMKVDFEWAEFIANKSAEYMYHQSDKSETRRLKNYDEIPWFNYFPMTDVKTEYYFRYSGSQTIPPCYGKYFKDTPTRKNRHQTLAWRVMKDPVLISSRQLKEMHRLLKYRIAPPSSPVAACTRDSAAKMVGQERVDVARPLQETRDTHYMVFCECTNWRSTFEEDKNWCLHNSLEDRLYKWPYNFDSSGF